MKLLTTKDTKDTKEKTLMPLTFVSSVSFVVKETPCANQ
jgi:hypothetical protein